MRLIWSFPSHWICLTGHHQHGSPFSRWSRILARFESRRGSEAFWPPAIGTALGPESSTCWLPPRLLLISSPGSQTELGSLLAKPPGIAPSAT